MTVVIMSCRGSTKWAPNAVFFWHLRIFNYTSYCRRHWSIMAMLNVCKCRRSHVFGKQKWCQSDSDSSRLLMRHGLELRKTGNVVSHGKHGTPNFFGKGGGIEPASHGLHVAFGLSSITKHLQKPPYSNGCSDVWLDWPQEKKRFSLLKSCLLMKKDHKINLPFVARNVQFKSTRYLDSFYKLSLRGVWMKTSKVLNRQKYRIL